MPTLFFTIPTRHTPSSQLKTGGHREGLLLLWAASCKVPPRVFDGVKPRGLLVSQVLGLTLRAVAFLPGGRIGGCDREVGMPGLRVTNYSPSLSPSFHSFPQKLASKYEDSVGRSRQYRMLRISLASALLLNGA